jgi:serine phosphatase RsbU (regulator of sigma subunit)
MSPDGRGDRRALVAGLVALGATAVVYPLIEASAARPLAVFVLPCFLAAVLGGWRPTVVVSVLSFAIAVGYGVAGPLDWGALTARWAIVAAGAVMGAVAATVRERQAGRLAELDEAIAMREAFERTLAPAPIAPARFVAAARYRPAETRMELGGDFLEAVGLADGRFAFLIGDVSGHGPREAGFGAALRAGWKSVVLSTRGEPADWMAAVHDAFFCDGRIDSYVTMCTGYLDVDAGTSCFVNAGHPPPLLLGDRTHVLDVPPSPPLGIGAPPRWTATHLPWDGTPVLLYTDGLIENPRASGPPQRWGLEGLLEEVARIAPGPPARMVDALLAAALRDREARDDVAVLLLAAAR